ncbi:MAG: cytochrome o ubiquinol oxidase subunit IV [Steroidobacteraceae bacterium]|nr:cytochrome o ubiquinol oxidase subunit IV [Steroidobacteraceae bacterium]
MNRSSGKVHTHAADHRQVHGHEAGQQDAHATLKGYLTGFVLAAVLTAIPFWLVMDHVIQSKETTILVVLALGAVQIVVHMVYFLHMNTTSESGWNMLALIFTLVLVVIVLGASIWVMHNENANMMPMSPQYAHHKMGS